MANSSRSIVLAAGGLLLLGACTYNPAPAPAPAAVVVQERAPPATVVSPGSSVVIQPRY
jgi:hypothetical protein